MADGIPSHDAHSHEQLARRLGQVRHFRGLPLPELEAIVSAGQLQRVPAGTTIFHEGAPCAGLYVLLKGHVHLCKVGPQGQQSILAVVRPVIMFNEVAALDHGPNPVSAVAVDDCLVWRIGPEAFKDLLTQYPQIGYGLATVLAARNRFLVEQVEDLSFRTVLARTAKLLLAESDNGQRPISRQRNRNHEMAARIATVPEALSRSLRFLRKQGYIETTRDTITICDLEKLAHLAEITPGLLED